MFAVHKGISILAIIVVLLINYWEVTQNELLKVGKARRQQFQFMDTSLFHGCCCSVSIFSFTFCLALRYHNQVSKALYCFNELDNTTAQHCVLQQQPSFSARTLGPSPQWGKFIILPPSKMEIENIRPPLGRGCTWGHHVALLEDCTLAAQNTCTWWGWKARLSYWSLTRFSLLRREPQGHGFPLIGAQPIMMYVLGLDWGVFWILYTMSLILLSTT